MAKTKPKPKKSQSNLPTIRKDYSVVFLNAQNASLDPILGEFYREAELQKRRAIVAIHSDYVTMKIMSEKDNVDILRARPFLLACEEVPTDIVLYIINQRIDEYLAENDRILKIQEVNRQFDMLDFWTQNDDPVMGTPQEAASVKGGKTKDKKAAKDPASTAPTGKKSKIDATVKVDALEKAFPPVYITKDWSALALRGQNSNLKVYIEDAPIDGPNLYVVVMGIYDQKVISELLTQGTPIRAIVNLGTPDTDVQVTEKHTKFWKDIDRMKPTDSTKPTAFYGVQTHVHHPDFLKENIMQIDTELSALVYDSEDIWRQHKNYLDNIDELNVNEKAPCPNLTDSKTYTNYFNDLDVEHTGVEHVLDALLRQVEQLLPNEVMALKVTHPSLASVNCTDYSQLPLNQNYPLACFLDTKRVLEHQDELFQRMQHLVDPQHLQYLFRLTALVDEWKLAERFEDAQSINLLKSFVDNQKDCFNLEYLLNVLHINGFESSPLAEVPNEEHLDPHSISRGLQLSNILEEIKRQNIEVTEHVELLTPSALQQQIVQALQTFDNMTQTINPLTNSLLITFSNNGQVLQTSSYEQHLTTKVCFRDYVDYVINEEMKWILSQENIYDQGLGNREDVSRMGKKSYGSLLPVMQAAEFLRNRSLKKHGNENFVADLEPPKAGAVVAVAVVEEKKSSSKKGTDKKKEKNVTTLPAATVGNKSSQDTNQNTIESTEGSKIKAFTGYNLGDRRFQVNGEKVVYRTAIGTIRYHLVKWLYPENVMNVDVEVNDFHLLFGNVFSSRGFPLHNLDHAVVKGKDGMSLCFEVLELDAARRKSESPSLEHFPINCRPSDHSLVDPDPRELVLRYTWPTGLVVKTISNTKHNAIEQMWTKPKAEEQGRILHANGCVVVYYISGKICVMSSTGMIIDTGIAGEWDDEVAFVRKPSPLIVQTSSEHSIRSIKSSREKIIRESREKQVRGPRKRSINDLGKHSDALNLAFAIIPELENAYFKLTTTDGLVMIINNGQVEKNLKPLYFKENFDFEQNELYVRREDGVKIIYRAEQTRCLYPDGTEIWSSLTEKAISSYMEFEFGEADRIITKRERSEHLQVDMEEGELNDGLLADDDIGSFRDPDDYLMGSPSSVSRTVSLSSSVKQENMINTVVTKLINFSTDDAIRIVNRTFTILHKKYETIEFDNTQGLVKYPNSGIVLSRNHISANVNDTLQLRCDIDGLEMIGMHCKVHSKVNTTKLRFGSQDDLIMSNDDGFQKRFYLHRSGMYSLDTENAPTSLWMDVKKCSCGISKRNTVRRFAVNQKWLGYEIHSKPTMDRILNDPNLIAVLDEDDTITILKPFVDELGKYGHQALDPNDKFNRIMHNVICCEPTVELATVLRGRLPDKMLIRHFMKISTDVILPDCRSKQSITSVVRKKSKTFTIAPVTEVFCEAAHKVLEWYLDQKEQQHIEENTPKVKPLSQRFVEMRDEIKNEFARAHLYRRMLHTGFVPFFFDDFVNARQHVRNLDADHMMAYMDAVDEHRRLQLLALDEKRSVADMEEKKSAMKVALAPVADKDCVKKLWQRKCECCRKECVCDAYKSIEH